MPDATVICRDIDGNQQQVAVDQLRWRPSAYAIVVKDGAILLSQEPPGKFGLPGGGVKLGELPEEAVIREVWEEAGLVVDQPRLVACHSNFFIMPTSKKEPYIQSLLLFYCCNFVDGEVTTANLPDEDKPFHGDSIWSEVENLDTLEFAHSSLDVHQIIKSALITL